MVNFDFGSNNTSVSNHFLVDFDRLYVAIRFLQVFIYIDECHCTSIKYSHDMSRLVGKPTMWFPNRSDTNRPVQSQKRARSLKFWSKVEEELYYPSSEKKGADQLRGYREADLRLCFRLCRLLVFPWGGSHYIYSMC